MEPGVKACKEKKKNDAKERQLMKVIILCGGKGTRLKEHTESLPKPLIEIGNFPILWHIMKIYASQGFNDFVLCLGYKGELIKEYFMDARLWRRHDFSLQVQDKGPQIQLIHPDIENWKITFVSTGEETNTGGRIKRVESLIQDDAFMVTYGDGVADIDIKKLVEFHRAHGKVGTVTAANPPSQFGLLDIQADGRVTRFQEKPATSQWINGGFFVFQKKFFSYLGDNDILEKAPLEKLASEGQLVAYKHNTFWKCMDTYKDTVTLNEIWATGKAPWKVWRNGK